MVADDDGAPSDPPHKVEPARPMVRAAKDAEVVEKNQEGNAEGSIGMMVYKEYLKLGTGCCGVMLWLLMDLAMQSLYVFADWWLTRWFV